MSGHATLLAVVAAVIAAVVAMTLGMTWIICRHNERMAELGYQEEMIPGSSMPHWRKCR